MAPWWTNLSKRFREHDSEKNAAPWWKRQKRSREHDLEKNGEYVPGQPFLTEDELKNISPRCGDLHSYYLRVFPRQQQGINLSIKHHHFNHSDGALSITVPWSDLWNLYNLKELNASLMRCWTLHLIKTCDDNGIPIGFIDPYLMSDPSIEVDGNKIKNYLADALVAQWEKASIVVAYYSVEYRHWITIAISPSKNKVRYLDSMDGHDWRKVKKSIDEAWSLARDEKGLISESHKLVHSSGYKCARKPGLVECGYYTCHNMLSIVECLLSGKQLGETSDNCDMKNIRNQLGDFLMGELDASSSELVTSRLEECSLASRENRMAHQQPGTRLHGEAFFPIRGCLCGAFCCK